MEPLGVRRSTKKKGLRSICPIARFLRLAAISSRGQEGEAKGEAKGDGGSHFKKEGGWKLRGSIPFFFFFHPSVSPSLGGYSVRRGPDPGQKKAGTPPYSVLSLFEAKPPLNQSCWRRRRQRACQLNHPRIQPFYAFIITGLSDIAGPLWNIPSSPLGFSNLYRS